MNISFGSRAPSKDAIDTIRTARTPRAIPRSGGMPTITAPMPPEEIRLDQSFGHQWPARDQFGRGTCVAFATIAAVELLQARSADMPPERLSEQFLHDTIIHMHPLGDAAAAEVPEGGVLLHQALSAVQKHGVFDAKIAPYKPAGIGINHEPEKMAEVLNTGTGNTVDIHAYGTIGDAPELNVASVEAIAPGEQTAETLLSFLRADLPVAVGLPLFRHASGLSNWTTPSAIRSGIILCPEDAGAPTFEGPRTDGHVVCVTGFIPDPAEPLGGWFVFRNSWGLEFASHANLPDSRQMSGTRGYGLLSATHVNNYCWEYLVLKSKDPEGTA